MIVSQKAKDSIFQISARRCKRCGGILTSVQGIRDGYGSCCLKKVQQEARAREQLENQCSLFSEEGDDS